MIIGEMLDGFMTAVTFKALDLFMPDRSLEEQKKFNDAMISLERGIRRWIRNELEQAQRGRNEARQSEIQTRIRLAKKPTLQYQPTTTFNNVRASVMVASGVGLGLVTSKFL